LALALLITASAAIAAKTPTSLAVIAKSSSNYEVVYSANEKTTVRISIVDENGNRLSSRIIRNIEDFKIPVALMDVGPGKYFVIVDNGNELLKKELATILPRQIYSHVAKLSDNRYLVSISNTGSSQPVNISVYDGFSNLLQSLNEVVDGQKAVVVNTQNVKGIPTFRVTDPSGQAEVIFNPESK
jgi:hypothetical protein